MLDYFLVVDVEATDKIPTHAQLLTGHFLLVDKDFDIVDRYDLKVRPRLWDKAAEDAQLIHGIGLDKAKHFPEFQEALTEFHSWLSTLPVCHFVAHANRTIFGRFSTYDYAVLTANLFDLNFHWQLYSKCPRKYILSTHSIAKYLKLPCAYDLKSIAQYLGLGGFNHHEAEADTLVCYEILKRLYPQIGVREFLDYENFKLIQEVENANTRPVSEANSIRKRPTKRSGVLSGNTAALI